MARQRRQMRTRERGIAMMEFVIVLPILIVLWAGCNYFFKSYYARLDVKHAARTEAWKRGVSGDCSQSIGMANLAGYLAQSTLTIPLAVQGVVTEGQLMRPMSGVEAHATLAPVAPSPILSFLTGGKPAEGGMYMVCNDKDLPPAGDNEGLLPFAEIWYPFAKLF